MTDFDQPNMTLVNEIVSSYEASARRLRDMVITPPGRTPDAREFNQARASAILMQVQGEIVQLKNKATTWTGKALSSAVAKGVHVADQQALAAGVKPPAAPLQGAFHVLDRQAVEILARDTVGDLHKGADSMGNVASSCLRKMAATRVSNADVNRILAGGVIEGQPDRTIRELRDALKAVYKEQVVIKDKNGADIHFETGYYARLVAVNKTREATVKARHARLGKRGMDLVKIIGLRSGNFCTAYLGKVFSISGSSKKYPPLDSLPGDGPPFHPNCSKSTVPFIAALADPEELEAAEPDAETREMLRTKNTTDLQHQFQKGN